MTDPRLSIIPAGAVLDKRLKARDLQVLCVFGKHTDKKGWCTRSQVKMAREMGCARSTVQGSIDRLVEAGWLQKRIEKKPGEKGERDGTYEYRVVLDQPDQTQDVVGPPADISAPPADPEPAPPADSGSAPKNVSSRTKRTPQPPEGGEGCVLDIEEEFQDFIWQEFPRHPDSRKAAALKAYQRLPRSDQIACMRGVTSYSIKFDEDQLDKRSREQRLRYVPHLANWINQRGWEAELETT